MASNVSISHRDSVQPLGSDGLTDGERAQIASRYDATVGRTTLGAEEHDMLDRWLASRAAR